MIWVAYRRSADEAAELVASTDSIELLLESDDDETSVDLGKAWHGIHWLLTGSPDSTDDVTSEAILGGQPVGEDLGYGPARLLDLSACARSPPPCEPSRLRSCGGE